MHVLFVPWSARDNYIYTNRRQKENGGDGEWGDRGREGGKAARVWAYYHVKVHSK